MTGLEFETIIEDPALDLSPAEREAVARNLMEIINLKFFKPETCRGLIQTAIDARDDNRRLGRMFPLSGAS